MYDKKVPLLLRKEQEWFGSIIGRPIDVENKINPIAPSGRSINIEAAEHIAPSPTLQPHQRIEIYNQQYWWRLLNTLHASFPLTVRLLDYSNFNQMIGFPYLTKYPPEHWSLALLGDRLTKWCEEDYAFDGKQVIQDAITLDWTFTASFICGSLPPLTPALLGDSDQAEAISGMTLYLQPFIFLFDHRYNLFQYRMKLLEQDCDYWIKNGLPLLDTSKRYYHVLFRNNLGDISWKEISYSEYFILCQFQKGATIDQVCELLEELEPSFYEAAATNLQYWFHDWTQREWLSFQD